MSDDAFSASVRGVADLVESDTNKIRSSGETSPEGASGERIDVLDLPMSDEELLKLRDDWELQYAPYEGKIKPIFERNLRSYLGRQKDGSLLDSDQPGPANLQFEAEETFLPAALAQNPDPLVYCDDSPEGNAIADAVKAMLQFHADQFLLKRKLEVMVRQWSIYHLGVLKFGWNKYESNGEEKGDVSIENRKIQDFIFDPNGYVNVFGDFSSWMGERIYVTADKLIEMFPKHEAYISLLVNDKLGTEVCYTEWWTDEICFTTFKEKVLDKHKNEFFNYKEKQEADPLTGLTPTQKRNHFSRPQKPYVFLSVFSLQEQPHDITGLIEQNIPNQAKISKRVDQIDALASQMVNGLVFSEGNFNQETAKQAANALSNPNKGKVLVPQGENKAQDAIGRIPAADIPEAAFKDLEMSENHLKESWGVQGIASQEQKPEQTARGMILNQGRDTSRIGGGISDIVEQSVARGAYNWLLQLYMVFYDEPHFASVLGIGKAVQYIQLSNQSVKVGQQTMPLDRQLIVGVAPNSMLPKDDTSRANQATQLFSEHVIGPKTLLQYIAFPNAEEAAADGALYWTNPQAYIQLNFPELAQQLAQIQQQQMASQQQAVEQQQGQEAQAHGQQMGQKEADHAQKMRHGEEGHKQKIQQSTEQASAKLAQMKQAMPK